MKNTDVLAVVMAAQAIEAIGLPGKALRALLGKPVLAYTLEHVWQSKLITRSVVSSDDAAILNVARAAGFEVIERPPALATAASATDPVLRHAVRSLHQDRGKTTENTESTEADGKTNKNASVDSVVHSGRPSAVVMLYGNVPIRRGQMIDKCIQMLLDTNCDSVQTIAPVGKNAPLLDVRPGNKRRHKKTHRQRHLSPRQDLPPLYSPTGAVYVMRTDVLMATEGSADPHAFLGKDRRGLVVAAEDSVDIDTEKDLFVAEAVLRATRRRGRVKRSALPIQFDASPPRSPFTPEKLHG